MQLTLDPIRAINTDEAIHRGTKAFFFMSRKDV